MSVMTGKWQAGLLAFAIAIMIATLITLVIAINLPRDQGQQQVQAPPPRSIPRQTRPIPAVSDEIVRPPSASEATPATQTVPETPKPETTSRPFASPEPEARIETRPTESTDSVP